MVSVVIPNYNSGKYLIKAVESVLCQDVPLEVIIVDDCSTDKSVDHLVDWLKKKYEVNLCADVTDCKRFICRGSRDEGADDKSVCISIYENKNNKGVAYSRNKAVNYAKGEYVAFLDADDWWEENKLNKQLSTLKKSNAVLCNTARELVDESGHTTGRVIETPEQIDIKKLKRTNHINCSSVLVRTEIMKKYPMEHSDAQEDYLTWLRIAKAGKSIVGINEPLMKYRLTAKGKSRNKIKSAMMTYKTYVYAGFGIFKSMFMMISYTWNGIRKYTK